MSTQDDSVIVPVTTSANIKTFKTTDSNSNTVETQAMAIVDEAGKQIIPLTEETGQLLAGLLRAIDAKLAVLTDTLPSDL